MESCQLHIQDEEEENHPTAKKRVGGQGPRKSDTIYHHHQCRTHSLLPRRPYFTAQQRDKKGGLARPYYEGHFGFEKKEKRCPLFAGIKRD